MFATKLAPLFFVEQALWPNTNIFPSLLITRRKVSMKTCKIDEYNWQSAPQFQIENHLFVGGTNNRRMAFWLSITGRTLLQNQIGRPY
ncbi:MAG: hypothetical protein Q7U03_13105 [Syntrophales bacterium]|nr:hypothetical protein [Syntrophales bacterium]